MSILADDLKAIERSAAAINPTVTFGANTATALAFEEKDVPENDSVGVVLVRRRVLTLRTGALALVAGSQVVINGTTYTVREPRIAGAIGQLTQYILV